MRVSILTHLDFHDEVQERIGHASELMRHPRRHGQHIARRKLVVMAAGDRRGAKLAVSSVAHPDHLAARDDSRGALH
jgi:hypothetical protein